MDSLKNNDPFKQFVKSKLADYKQEVPHSGWEKLESSLSAAQKGKIVHTKWLASSVAAVAAALIGVFFLFQNMNNELPIQTAEHKTAPLTTPKGNKQTPLTKEQSTSKTVKPEPALFADNTSSVKEKISVSIAKSRNEETSTILTTDNINDRDEFTPATLSKEQSKESKKSSEIDEATKQQMLQDFINDGKRTFDDFEDTQNKSKQKKSRHAISLAGRSGLSSSQQTSMLPTTLRSSLDDSYGTYTISKMQAFNEEKEVFPESETNHIQPVSFGVLTSFNLTKKLQIETGIIYTYLSSETKNYSNDFSNTEKVQFHYLGIPVNLNYTVLSVNKLDLFVSAGAMIEKDIYGKIKYNDEKTIGSLSNSSSANESSSKINQKNPQLSVTGGLGITYPVYNKTNLFGKIGGRYNINANNEYKTYYSDEKFGLDIQLGIKFNF